MRRVVFDSTVLVSGFLRPGGLADELLTLAAEGQFELVLSGAAPGYQELLSRRSRQRQGAFIGRDNLSGGAGRD